MLTSPRKYKYKKIQKGNIPNKIISSTNNLNYGSFAFKAIDFGILTSKQIEAAQKVISKKIKIYPGTILYEIEGISLKLAQEIFKESSQKLSLKCKLLCY